MIEPNIHSVLTIGMVDVTSLATSARRAGYNVYAVDYYGDQDLEHTCIVNQSLMKQGKAKFSTKIFNNFDTKPLLQLARDLQRNNVIDVSLLSSGLDDSPETLYDLNDIVPILGNTPESFLKVRNRSDFFTELEQLQIPHPRTAIAQDLKKAKSMAKDLGFPLLIKPMKGFGGVGIRMASNLKELEKGFKTIGFLSSDLLLQEFIQGMHASASIVSIPGKAVTLAVSEQLLGLSEVGQQETFGYCGNIVPLSAPAKIIDKCKDVAERVVTHFNLVGSNGVDLVVSNEGTPYVIEVNPRFQGTIECIEQVLGLNIVDAHVKACIGEELPTISHDIQKFCMRLILFAKQRSLMPDLSVYRECRDVPSLGSIVEKGEPLCSIIVEDAGRSTMLDKAKQISATIYSSLSSIE